MAEEVVFAHHQNDLTMVYVGLHYSSPAENQYAYMLDGYEKGWREVGTQRTAIYTNLPPGDFVFRVKAANSDGVWNEEGASLRITIHPPWWRTSWAYVFYGLLFLAGVFALERVHRRRLILRERERTRQRELEQAREIEKAYHQLDESHRHLKATQAQLIQQEKLASLAYGPAL